MRQQYFESGVWFFSVRFAAEIFAGVALFISL